MTKDDRLLNITKATFIPLALLSLTFGPLLFLLPNQNESYFAWTIAPTMSAVFIGAGYTSGALIIFRLMLLGRWHPMRPFALGGWGFIAAILGATLLHWDKFHHGTIFFYIWFVVYAAGPFLVPIACYFNEKHNAPPAPHEVLLAAPIRYGLIAMGLIFSIVGVVLFINPALFAPIWPWQLSPLIGRVVAAWIFLPSMGALGAWYEPRYTAYRPLVQFSVIWALLVLVGSLLHLGDFDFSRPLAWLWFVYLVLVIPAAFLVYWYHERLYAHVRPTEGVVAV